MVIRESLSPRNVISMFVFEKVFIRASFYPRKFLPIKYLSRFEGTDDVENLIHFQPLDLIFTAGYLSMDHYIGTVYETVVTASDRTDTTFVIPIPVIHQLVPQWKDLLSLSTEFGAK